jgi:hypothetical protein
MKRNKKTALIVSAAVLVLAGLGLYRVRQAVMDDAFYYFKIPQNEMERSKQRSAQDLFARFPWIYERALVLAAQDPGMNPFQRGRAIEQLADRSLPPNEGRHVGVIAGLLEDKLAEIRVAAVDALYVLAEHGQGSRIPLDTLHHAWEMDQDFIVQFHICRLLLKLGDKASIEPLRWKLNLSDERVRAISTVALYSMTGDKIYLNSLKLYSVSHSYPVQSITLAMMGESDDPKMLPLLRSRLRDKNPIIRKYAKDGIDRLKKAGKS